MSRIPPTLCLVAVMLLGGACAHRSIVEVADAVGPPRPSARPPALGFLRVYTPTREYQDEQTFYYPHRSYRILASNGRLLEWVPNADDPWDETPARVELPPGTYRVRSETLRSGIAEIPVAIEVGRTTEVYLDGSFERKRREGSGAPHVAAARDDLVRLPDGEIIGFRARR